METSTPPPPTVTNPPPTASPTPPAWRDCLPVLEPEEAIVTNVVDGDTIDVQLSDGRTESLRYIGIDTPERGDLYYEESARVNEDLVLDKTVSLVLDVSEIDPYDRLLRYVLVGDIFVNYEMVRRGYATAVTFPPDVACAEVFQEAERLARLENAGLWGLATEPTPARLETLPAGCDPAYPEVCIPSPPPDLDCRDVSYRRFKVLPPDPHHFDMDQNGFGCEQ